MLLRREVIAKKYAQALLSLYYKKLDDQSFSHLLKIEEFFRTNKKISVYLSIPTISENNKEKALDAILDSLKAGTPIKIIAHALLRQKRIELFDKVLHQIVYQLRLKRNILQFKVTSSHELSDQDRNKILNFLTKKTGAFVEAIFTLDKSLISGIRIKGDYFLWERSLAKLLQCIKLPFIQRARS